MGPIGTEFARHRPPDGGARLERRRLAVQGLSRSLVEGAHALQPDEDRGRSRPRQPPVDAADAGRQRIGAGGRAEVRRRADADRHARLGQGDDSAAAGAAADDGLCRDRRAGRGRAQPHLDRAGARAVPAARWPRSTRSRPMRASRHPPPRSGRSSAPTAPSPSSCKPPWGRWWCAAATRSPRAPGPTWASSCCLSSQTIFRAMSRPSPAAGLRSAAPGGGADAAAGTSMPVRRRQGRPCSSSSRCPPPVLPNTRSRSTARSPAIAWERRNGSISCGPVRKAIPAPR